MSLEFGKKAFGRRRRIHDAELVDTDDQDSTLNRLVRDVGVLAGSARKELLDAIGRFLLKYDLEISNANLAFANSALSGHNQRFASKLAAREISGKTISQEWIDQTLRLDESLAEQVRDVDALMDAFEALMDRFAMTTETACAATASYSDVVGQQCDALEAFADQPAAAPLLRISRAMMDRLQQIEGVMNESRAETEHLSESLMQARREAELDHLTGLPNRRAFERRFASAVSDARQSGQPLCVAFCDIDHFKQINDNHGHEAGDRVLQAVSDTLRESASSECFVARHGGEEFALLFANLDSEKAWCKLESVRRILADKRFRNRDTDTSFGRITFSAGLAQWRVEEDPRTALSRADAALYLAKRSGRNRVEAA